MNKNSAIVRGALRLTTLTAQYSLVVATFVMFWMIAVRFNPWSNGHLQPDAYYLYAVTALAVLLTITALSRFVLTLAGYRSTSVGSAAALLIPAALVLGTSATRSDDLLSGAHWMLLPEWTAMAAAALVWAACIAAYRRFETPSERRERQQVMRSTNSSASTPEQQSEAVVKFPAIAPRKSFGKIVGMSAVKESLLNAGTEVMAARTSADDARNGILLFGDPGNGKTMFAEALAFELRLPFLNVSFGNVVSRWVGETTENVMQVFAAAREQAPCVLFVDEIDSLIRDRSASGSSSSEDAKTTNTLLTEIVKLREHKVVLIAATNFLDKLDPAAIREGRFDYKIEITPPDLAAREAILRASTKGRLNTGDLDVELEDGAVETSARRWEGFSAARIHAIGRQAAKAAAATVLGMITFEDLMVALRTVQGRAGKLPEGTLGLEQLTLPPELAAQLKGLALRMQKIAQIEEAGGTVPHGVLFAGPPGTGKTLTARALAKSSQWAFLSVAGNELLSDPDKIEQIIKEARDIRPCIVFVDEADDVLADRQMARHTASVTNRLLTAMDGATGKASDVLWIAATNHPEMLDAAALRGGRFTLKMTFQVPDHATLKTHIEQWMAKCQTPFALEADCAANELAGLSIANVNEILQHAVNEAVVRQLESANGKARITLAAVQEAKRMILG